MKKLLALLLLLSCAQIATAQTVVQKVFVQASSSQNPAPSLTGVAAGDYIVAVASFSNGTNGQSFGTPTDSSTQTWPAAKVTQVTANAPYGQGAEAWVLTNATAGTHTVTFNNSVGLYCYVGLIEVSGATSVDKAVSAVSSGAGSTSQSISSGTLSASNELAIADLGVSAQANVAAAGITDPPSGWVSIYAEQAGTTSDQIGEAASRATSSTSSITASWTWTTGSSAAGAVMVTLEGSAASCTAKPKLSNGHPMLSNGKPILSCG